MKVYHASRPNGKAVNQAGKTDPDRGGANGSGYASALRNSLFVLNFPRPASNF